MARIVTAFVTLLLAGIAWGQTTPEPRPPRIANESTPQQSERCPEVPPPAASIDPTTALQLLDRVQAVLDEAVNDESPTSVTPVGTSGSKGVKAAEGKVRIDRSRVDEIRAELGQVKTLLKK